MRSPIARVFAAGCALLAVAFLALWLRSYWKADELTLVGGRRVVLRSNYGVFEATLADRTLVVNPLGGVVPPPPTKRWEILHRSAGADAVSFRLRSFGIGINRRVGGGAGGRSMSYARLPHGAAAAACLALSAGPVLFARRRRARRRSLGLCPACGYDVRWTGVCPECGPGAGPSVE